MVQSYVKLQFCLSTTISMHVDARKYISVNSRLYREVEANGQLATLLPGKEVQQPVKIF